MWGVPVGNFLALERGALTDASELSAAEGHRILCRFQRRAGGNPGQYGVGELAATVERREAGTDGEYYYRFRRRA